MPVEFQPHPALRSAHAQTRFPALLRRAPTVPWRRERREHRAGGFSGRRYAHDLRLAFE